MPPDGGWGWVVVFGSFMCNFIVDGIIMTTGMLYPKFKQEYGASNVEVAWISSLLGGFYLLVGKMLFYYHYTIQKFIRSASERL